jgi:NADH:ubiquinone oxidoreductase subunit D
MYESCYLIYQCLEFLEAGPTTFFENKVSIPSKLDMRFMMESLIQHFKVFTEGLVVPKGECFIAVEAPKGEFGIFLYSSGINRPYRCKIKAPGFTHLQVLNFLSTGHMIADIVTIIGTLDIVFGEVDR